MGDCAGRRLVLRPEIRMQRRSPEQAVNARISAVSGQSAQNREGECLSFQRAVKPNIGINQAPTRARKPGFPPGHIDEIWSSERTTDNQPSASDQPNSAVTEKGVRSPIGLLQQIEKMAGALQNSNDPWRSHRA